MAFLRLPYCVGLCLVASAIAAQACTPGTYSVTQGETLTQIAEETSGSVFTMPDLLHANKATLDGDPNRLNAGDALSLPCREGDAFDWSRMPDAQDVALVMRHSDLQVLDVREAFAVSEGVLPRTRHVPFDMWPNSSVDMQPRVAALLGWVGLRLDRPILIVGGSDATQDMGRAAYVYWLLKSSGATQLAILRDGVAGWQEAGLPLAEAPNEPRPSSVALHLRPDWSADQRALYTIASENAPGLILDARPISRLSRGRALPQLIPMPAYDAPVRPIQALIRTFRAAPSLEATLYAVLDEIAAHQRGPVIAIGGRIEPAALNWFLLSEVARLDDVRLHPRPVTGWAQDPEALLRP